LKLGRKTPGVKSIPYLFCIFVPKGYYHKTIVIYGKTIVKIRSRGQGDFQRSSRPETDLSKSLTPGNACGSDMWSSTQATRKEETVSDEGAGWVRFPHPPVDFYLIH